MLSGIRVCDGGLGTTLALLGYGIDEDPLWSARLLHTQPHSIQQVHAEFAAAGASILVSASYQASVEGLRDHLSVTAEVATELIESSVGLARAGGGKGVLVAGSVGPWGACQADGSEFSGAYVAGMTQGALQAWHRPRVAALLRAGADLLAVETIPAVDEALAIIGLLKEFPGTKAWVTFSCKDAGHTNSGDDFSEAVHRCYLASGGQGGDRVLAGVGVNCTAPHLISPLLESLNSRYDIPPPQVLPRVVYPNSGEQWIPGQGWVTATSSSEGWAVSEWVRRGAISKWVAEGAAVVGGCCRVGPSHIAAIASNVKDITSEKEN